MKRSGTWVAALLAGESTYHGKLCIKHPEIEGLRYSPSTSCVYCAQERSLRVSKAKAAARRAAREQAAQQERTE